MSESPELYLGRAAPALYALLYADAPYPTSTKALAYFGPFGDVVKLLRDVHQSAAARSAKTGQIYDVWAETCSVWEGLRSGDNGTKQYGLLDRAIRELGTLIHDEPTPAAPEPPIAQRLATNGTKPRTEYVIADWKPDIISAAALRATTFPALIWLVDGIIPEGAVMLAGKPKSKKSWLALAVAVAVAYSGKAFGYYDVAGGRVLYLDLESNQRRMQSRLRAVIGERAAWPTNFDIATEWKRGDEGITYLDGYCDAHPDTRLVVIDIWAKFRAPRDAKADPYEQDYNALQALNAWAERRRVTVIVIHHTRKMKADDVFQEISGTTGIIGAVATAMVLSRSPDMPEEQILHRVGRDLIEDDPIALKWDGYTCQHIYVATGKEASSSAERRRILDVMEDEQEYPIKEIAALVGKSLKTVDNQLRRLMDDELIARTGRGKYAKVIKPSGKEGNHGIRGDDGIGGKFSSTLSTSDSRVESDVENDPPYRDAVNGSFHQFHDDSHPTPNRDLFDENTPDGLTPAQWEQARYHYGMGHWSQFADVARAAKYDYQALRAAVEQYMKDTP